MTVASTTSRWDFTGDGSTTIFAYSNKIFASSELLVYVAGVLQTETTHYSVSGAGADAGGNVTFVTAPANDAAVAILRNVANTQPAELPASGPLPSSSIEDSLDRRAIISQQQEEKVNRAMKFLASDTSLPSAELPALSTLKGKVLSFDATTGAPGGTSFGDISVAIDVVETSLTDNDFLVYDGTNWVNETPAEVRATLSVEQAAQDFEDVASATTTDLGAASSRNVRITGVAAITGFGTSDAGTYRQVRFAAALTLTHNGSSLILPGAANITTAANDTAGFVSLGSGNWLCLWYKAATGLPVAFVDEDDQVSDSAVKVPSQQSVKAYVDLRDGFLPTARAKVTNGGSAALAESAGVTSVNRTGAGTVDVVLADTMSSANYTIMAMQINNDGFCNITAQSTTGFTIRTDNSSGTAADRDFFFVVVGTKA